MAERNSLQGSCVAPICEQQALNCNVPVDEQLKRLTWASVSVPAPDAVEADIHRFLTQLKPELLMQLRATASLLEHHHTQVLDFLRIILESVNTDGYIAPVRVK